MAIDKNIFIHQDDRSALNSLRSIPGFTALTKAYMKNYNDRILYIDNMSTNILINEDQFSKYHNMLTDICKKLDIEKPELFLKRDVNPNAYTSGDDKPYIVMTTGLLDSIPEDLIPTVLAHECGHIVCKHVLYRTMGTLILNGALLSVISPLIRGILTYPLVSAFSYWMRCSEFSADRAAILCDGSPEKLQRLCMYFAGYDPKYGQDMDLQKFMDQARAYREAIAADKQNKTLESVLNINRSHPLNALRASEAGIWFESENYHKASDYLYRYHNGIEIEEMPLPFAEREFIGKKYEQVAKTIREYGFENISFTRNLNRKFLEGENTVTALSVNGSRDHHIGEWTGKDAKIEITYYLPDKEEKK